MISLKIERMSLKSELEENYGRTNKGANIITIIFDIMD